MALFPVLCWALMFVLRQREVRAFVRYSEKLKWPDIAGYNQAYVTGHRTVQTDRKWKTLANFDWLVLILECSVMLRLVDLNNHRLLTLILSWVTFVCWRSSVSNSFGASTEAIQLNRWVSLTDLIWWNQESCEKSLRVCWAEEVLGLHWGLGCVYWLHWWYSFMYLWFSSWYCFEWYFCQAGGLVSDIDL